MQRTLKLGLKIMSVTFAVLLTVASMGTAVFAVATYSMTDVAAGTAVAKGDTVEIGTAEELFAFAKYINDGNTGKGIIFKLTADIVLNDISDYTVWSEGYAPKNSWTPIGIGNAVYSEKRKPFSGTFDGAMHTVSGIYINSVSDYQGFFGYVLGGTIQDVGITHSYIKGRECVGGIAGEITNASTITDCYNTGSVTGTRKRVGGIVGNVSNTSSVDKCYNTGSVKGAACIGGVAGWTELYAKIHRCHNTGPVTGTGDKVGGIVGYLKNTDLNDCYNTGSVVGSKNQVGGISGHTTSSTDVKNCYNTGKVSGTKQVGGISGNVDMGSAVANCYNTGSVSGSDTAIGGIVGGADSADRYSHCFYLEGSAASAIGVTLPDTQIDTFNTSGVLTSAHIAGITANITLLRDALNAWVEDVMPEGKAYIKWVGTVYPVHATAVVESETVWSGNAATGFAGGTGEKDNPYIIETAEQFAYFAGQVNGGDTFMYKYIKLAADIALNDTANHAQWGYSPPARSWTPIGNGLAGRSFSGTFDGDGHTVSGVYVKTASDDDCGLFGFIQYGTIKNLGVINSRIVSDGYTGGIVGYAYGSSTIDNCYYSGVVFGGVTGGTGGIVGHLSTGTVCNSYNTATVVGINNTGGVVGHSSSGTIYNCYNAGAVEGSSYCVGGIAGRSETDCAIINCYNTGKVVGNSGLTGGVVGETNHVIIVNCYNIGEVQGDLVVGGIAGQITESSTAVNCYNAGSISGSEKVGGVVGGVATASIYSDCYYLTGSASAAIGDGSGSADAFDSAGKLPSGKSLLDALIDAAKAYNADRDKLIDLSAHTWAVMSPGSTMPVLVSETLYAPYSITYKDVGGADFSGTHADGYPQTHTYNSATTLKDASKDGYTFGGWFVASDGSGSALKSLDATSYKTNITLYAKFTPIPATPVIITYMTWQNESKYGIDREITVGATKPEGHTWNFKWYSNTVESTEGATLVGSVDSTTFTISPHDDVGTKYYFCVVTSTRTDNGQIATTTSNILTLKTTAVDASLIAPTAKTPKYNGSAQALVSAGSAIGGVVWYKLDGGTYATTIPTATNAGTYTVYYKVIGDKNHNDIAEKSVTVTISKDDSSLTAPAAKTPIYNGSAQALVSAGSATGGVLWYKLDNGTYATSIPTATNAGTYTVYYKVIGDKNHNDVAEKSVTVTISKDDSSLTAPAAKTPIYNGSAQALVSAGSATGGVVWYKLDNGTYATSIPTATNAGTYTVYYKVIGDKNHNDVAEKNVTVTISKGNASLTAPAAKTPKYNGSAQALVSAGSATGGVLWYKLDNGTYATTIPTATNAGTYTVYYKVIGDKNHNDVAEKNVTVTIGKADYDMSGITFADATAAFDGKAHSLVIGGTLPTGLDGITVTVTYSGQATNVSDGAVTVSATFATTSTNYNTPSAKTAKISITKTASAIASAPTANELTYNGSAQALVGAGSATGGVMWYKLDNGTYATTIPTASDAGEYIVYYKAVGDANHNDVAEGRISVTIAKDASAVSAAPTANVLTYNGSAQALVSAGSATGGVVWYKLGDGIYATELPTATNAGEYTVYYKVVGDANHNDVAESSVTVTIEKADYDMSGITFADTTIVYDKNAHSLVIGGTLPAGVTVSYTDNVLTKAGTLTVTASFAGDAENYNAIPDMSATLTIEKPDIQPVIITVTVVILALLAVSGAAYWFIISKRKKKSAD